MKYMKFQFHKSILLIQFMLAASLLLGLSSCNDSNNTEKTKILSPTTSISKTNLDNLLLKANNRNLPIRNMGNIDSIKGYRGLTLGLKLDNIEAGSFKRRIYMDGLLTIFRKSRHPFVDLSFYNNKLVKIEIQNEQNDTLHNELFIEGEDMLNTYGEPNIEKKTTVKKRPAGNTLSLKWRTSSSIEVHYIHATEEVSIASYFPPSHIDYTNYSFQYTITDLEEWKKYEQERSRIIKDKMKKDDARIKTEDSLRIRRAQNKI